MFSYELYMTLAIVSSEEFNRITITSAEFVPTYNSIKFFGKFLPRASSLFFL